MSLDRVHRHDREQIRIVIADADRPLRSALRQALVYAGFRSVIDLNSAESLRQALEESTPDLLLVAARLPDGDGCGLVRALRYSRCGRNPFLSVIMTAWPEEVEDIGRLINSGTDHIVLKPVAPQALFDRIEAMIERRKPFVATATYFGPDRRTGKRAETVEDIPTFEVPNTLRLRATGKPVDQAVLQRAVDASMHKINAELVRRQAFHLNFLVERAAPLLESGDPEAAQLVAEMGLAGRDLTRRLDMSAYAHVGELCRTLDSHLGAAMTRADGARWSDHDLLVLRKLSQAIYVGLHAQPDLGELARKVSDAVSTYQLRQTRRAGGPAG